MTLLKRLIAAVVLATYALNGLAIERVTYYHNDATGSPIAATDQNGQILWTEAYAPYGERLDKNAHGEPAYTGKFEEVDFGINYFNARWYDPKLGRFLATDPVRFTEANLQSFNRYAYGNNNPYKFVDPDGKFANLISLLIIATATYGLVSTATYIQSHPEAATSINAAIHQIGAVGIYGLGGVYQTGNEADEAQAGQAGADNGGQGDVIPRPDYPPQSGGRGGGKVKERKGPPKSAIPSTGRSIWITDDDGNVIVDVTPERAKPVKPGVGFGDKRPPTDRERDLWDSVKGGE